MHRSWIPVCALSLSMLAACSEGKPQLGGQTGDPGVMDFTSLDPDPHPQPSMPGGSECWGPVQVVNSQRDVYDLLSLAALNEAHLVFLDMRRGVSVVDVSGAQPRVVGSLPMTQHIGDVHVAGRYALVSHRLPKPYGSYFEENGYPDAPEGAELLVIDLSDAAQPRVVDRLMPPYAQRASFLVESGGTARLYVLSDDGAPLGCGVFDGRTRLISYELVGAQLVERAQLDLGAQPQDRGPLHVAQAGSDLVIVRADEAEPNQGHLSLISLASSDGAMTQSASIELPGSLVDVRADDPGTLRVVVTSAQGSLQVERYDIRDRSALVHLSSCAGPLSVGASAFTSYGKKHTFLAGGTNGLGNNTLVSIASAADGSCDVRETVSHGGSMIASDVALARAFDVGRDGADALKVKLLDEANLSVLDEAIANPEQGLDATGVGARVLRDASPSTAAGDTGVLAVSFLPPAVTGTWPGLQLFSFSADSIRARGSVMSAGDVMQTSLQQPLTWGPEGLRRLELGDLDAPAVSEPLDVAPHFWRVWAFDGYWVRLRSPEWNPEAGSTPDSDNALFSPPTHARLEVVTDDRDPDLGAATTSLDVNPWAHFVRVGELLVALIKPHGEQARPARLEVFDLSDPAHPRAAGSVTVPKLRMPGWSAQRLGSYWGENSVIHFCLDCPGADLDTRALAVPGALVLRILDDAGEPALQVLDLSDPEHPALSAPITGAPGERMISAFARGSSVYWTYRVEAAPSTAGADVPTARYYFRQIELSDPAQPAIGAPVSVPGQLVAVDGDQLFTREFVERGTGYETLVHRLALREGRAEVQTSHSFGGRMAYALRPDGAGHLLADLAEPLSDFLFEDFYETPRVELQVLDAETLELLGQAGVTRGARRADAHAGRVLYSAAEGYMLMDLTDPTAPRAGRYFSVLDPNSPQRAALAGGSLIIADSGALKRFALDTP